MRILKFKDKAVAVRATSLSRLFFVQEFDVELDKFLTDLYSNGNSDELILNGLYKILWVMYKSENYYLKKPTEDYVFWIQENKNLDLYECLDDILAEIKQGFTVTCKGAKSNQKDVKGLTDSVISIGLHMNMSLDDLNELTMERFLEIAKSYIGSKDEEDHSIAVYSMKDLVSLGF
jgi:hypothetical protein